MNGNAKMALKGFAAQAGGAAVAIASFVAILAAFGFLPSDFVSSKEFEQYKKSHDSWADVSIKRFEEKIEGQNEDIAALRIEIGELRTDVREFKGRQEALAERLERAVEALEHRGR